MHTYIHHRFSQTYIHKYVHTCTHAYTFATYTHNDTHKYTHQAGAVGVIFIDYDPVGRFSSLPRIEEGPQSDGSNFAVKIPTAFTLFRFFDVLQVGIVLVCAFAYVAFADYSL
jgi:hypothetical protein